MTYALRYMIDANAPLRARLQHFLRRVCVCCDKVCNCVRARGPQLYSCMSISSGMLTLVLDK